MEETMRTLFYLAAGAAALVIALAASRASAGAYRCKLEDGSISYQQFPCRNAGRRLQLETRPTGWSALRPGERALLKGYRAKPQPPQDGPEHKRRSTAQTKSCWRKRKQLEALRVELRRGYKLDDSETLHRKRLNYEDYLRQFCS